MAEAMLPTKEEIAQLPRRARFAYRVLCERNLLRALSRLWPTVSANHLLVLEENIEQAEQALSSPTVHSPQPRTASLALPRKRLSSVAEVIRRVANQAVKAKSARAQDLETADALVQFLVSSYNSPTAGAVAAVQWAARVGVPVERLRADFDELLLRARAEGWGDETPVPANVFEAHGIPDATANTPPNPLEADEHIIMSLRAFAEPGVSASMLAEHLLEVYKSLNEYTLAKYGKHLSRGQFRKLVCEYAGVPLA